jgi:signal peptidase I
LRFRANGGSMSPLVRDGDVVLVRPVEPSSVRVGDVVLCSSHPGQIVVHRVVRKIDGPSGDLFTVQGDQVTQADGTIPAMQVYGRVTTIERAGARINLDGPAMRWLSWLAVLRSRWALGRGRQFRLARRLIRRLPVLSRYLA